jgi:two-component system cell cycle sensor histidine kinase/response regulator CckA
LGFSSIQRRLFQITKQPSASWQGLCNSVQLGQHQSPILAPIGGELKNLRVLGVEDSTEDASILEHHLRKTGYSVLFERVDTLAGMQAALNTQEWDVIIADYSMPEFSALKALELLQQTGLDIPLFVISGAVGEELGAAAMQAGALDYFIKGNLARLGPAIERELRAAANRAKRRQADLELASLVAEAEQQNNRLNTIFASVPGFVWEAWGKPDSTTQHIDFVSGYVERMLGYTVQEWLSTPNFWLTVVHPDDRERAARESSECFSSGKPRLLEYRWVTRAGAIIWVQAHTVVVFDETGKPIGMRGVNIDITEQRQAQARLAESEERFRRYFELGLIGMAITSPAKGLLEINDRACEILGYSRSELLQVTWAELTHPDDLARDVGEFDRVVTGVSDGYTIHKRFIRKDGRVIDATVAGKCIRHADGSVAYFVVLIDDLTEYNRNLEALRDSEERYRLLFESNPDPVFVFDQETLAFLAFNEAAVQTYGYSRDELASMNSKDIRPASEIPDFLDRLSRFPDGPLRGSQWKHKRKDGSILDVEITRRSLLFAGRSAWIVLAHNVTDRRILEEQLRQSQKMDAVAQLAGGVAHDFNNLLTVINGYSSLALDRLGVNDPQRNGMEQIKYAADQAAVLTRQLLAFSRKQAWVPRIIDLNAVLGKLRGMLLRVIGEDIELRVALADHMGSIRADSGQIEQIVINLVVNARDAMPRGGSVMIETAAVSLTEDDTTHLAGLKTGPYIVLTVKDNGEGMDQQTQARIFEPFFTTKESGKGRGLGLSTVYGIVKQSAGNIYVHSGIGLGTTFKIYFPRVEATEGQHSLQSRPEKAAGANTILVAEDDDMVRALTCRVLSDEGFHVLESSSGESAIEMCKHHKDPIHLLITDVIMPKMNGRLLADHIRTLRPGIKVLYMSGYTDNAIVFQEIADGSVPFIQKPFAPKDLLEKVTEFLGAFPSTETTLYSAEPRKPNAPKTFM